MRRRAAAPAAVAVGLVIAVLVGPVAPGATVATAAASVPAPTPPTARLVAEALAVSTTTSTTVPESTTTAPTTTSTTTTTTLPPTTTTTTTSTTRPRETTTTAPATTTTTSPVATTKSSTPWALIAVIAVLVVAILVVVLLLRSRRRRAVEADWHRAVVPALSDAQLARVSLLSGNAESDDPQVRGAVEVQVEKAAVALERTVPSAPDPESGALATSAAGGLRGLAFAIEADRLLRHGTSPPSGLQLAQADEARRARTNELNTALARLSTRIGSGSAH
jgi:hypothetical protein